MYENIYDGIYLMDAADAKRESDDQEIINRRTDMSIIMTQIRDAVQSGGHNVQTWIKFDSTVNKLLELGYKLSNKNTLESVSKMYKPGDHYTFDGSSDQKIISW